MGWENRERGGHYYTRSRKVDGRVVREYVGGGVIGELAARFDEAEREKRKIEATMERLERARVESLVAPVVELCDIASIVGTVDTKGNGGAGVSKEVEFSNETKAKLKELQVLSEKAEAGEKGARRELRMAVRSSTPEVVAKASDFARKGHKILIGTAAAGDPLMEEALSARLELMRAQIAGEDPSPLETLLTERVVSC
jgi:hypothetical protein